jgi:hypothetical protein
MTRSALAAAFVLAAVLVLPAVYACGFTTHDFIAHRAREHFYDDAFGGKYSALVEANLDALQGGAPFPGRRSSHACLLIAVYFITFWDTHPVHSSFYPWNSLFRCPAAKFDRDKRPAAHCGILVPSCFALFLRICRLLVHMRL